MRNHKKLIYGVLSFLIPFILLIIMFGCRGLLNKQIVIKGDIYAQFFPLLNYLKGVFNGANSIFYSFYKNLGGTMFGTFFYYLSSPFNILVKFIKSEDLPLVFMWLAIIKMSLCSFSMYLFMAYKNKKTNLLMVAFSVCYGLMGYNINFFVNIMWLDVVILSPIVLIGLDKLISGKSPFLYIVSLFVSIVCNYYISYMLCIFCLIYFIYEILLRNFSKKEIICLIKKFVVFSFLTGLMCSFFLIPCFYESRSYFRSLDFDSVFSFNYNLFNVFSKSFIGSSNFKDLLNYSSINIYCGVFVFLLVFLFFINNKISIKKRRLTLFVIIFMILPCFVFPLNYIWHLFSSPNSYGYRYSFLMCFFLLNIAFESYNNLNMNKSILSFFLIYFVISVYFVLISFTKFYDFLSFENIFVSFIFLIIYFLVFKYKNKYKVYIFSIVIFLEIFLNLFLIFKNPIVFSKRNLVDSDYLSLVDKYKDSRMEFTDFLSFNDSILMEYYGINSFISTNNNRVMRFFIQMSSKEKFFNQNIYNYKYPQYVLDSLIGLKYIISSYEMSNYNLIEKSSIGGNDVYVYQNPNYSGIGYIINDWCDNIEFDYNYDEKVFNCITGNNHGFYKEYSIVKNHDNYSSIIRNDDNFYLYYPNIVDTNIRFKNDIISFSNDYAYIKSNQKNYNFEFSVDDIDFDKFKIYYFDFDKFKSIYSKAITETLDYEIIDNKIYGRINTDGGILMIAIPYEKGFIVKVDGKKVDYKEVLDTFIGIDLEKGYHEVTIEYKQPYLNMGIALSIISLILILLYSKRDVLF